MTRRRQPEAELFGQRLRQLRNDRGMAQVALAETSGLIDTSISDMERGLKVPSLTTLLRLAAALGCKVRDLVTVFHEEPRSHAVLLSLFRRATHPASLRTTRYVMHRTNVIADGLSLALRTVNPIPDHVDPTADRIDLVWRTVEGGN